jgi:hypothetical protein
MWRGEYFVFVTKMTMPPDGDIFEAFIGNRCGHRVTSAINRNARRVRRFLLELKENDIE